MFSNHACCCLFQMSASNMHQNEWFQVRFFKKFLEMGSPSPLPRPPKPLPRFRSGLRPRASPSILGRFAPSIVKFGPTTVSELPPPMLERNLCMCLTKFFQPPLGNQLPPMHNFLATGLVKWRYLIIINQTVLASTFYWPPGDSWNVVGFQVLFKWSG